MNFWRGSSTSVELNKKKTLQVGDEVVLTWDEEESSIIDAVDGKAERLIEVVGTDLDAIAEAARFVFDAPNDCDYKTVLIFATYLLFAGSKLTKDESPLKALARLRANSPKSRCGHVFRAGEIAWNCRDCQQDTTSVLCDTCFKESVHFRENHDVYFHRASAGGVCDCGDAEAWIGECRCALHDCTAQDISEEANELVQSLRAAAVVFQAAFEAAAQVSFLSAIDHDIVHSNSTNIRLYNDEIHSQDEARNALLAAGVETHFVRRLVSAVETRGEAIVISESSNDGLSTPTQAAKRKLAVLRENGLIASALGLHTQRAEMRARRASEWICSMLGVSDALRRCAAHAAIQFSRRKIVSPTELAFYGVRLRLNDTVSFDLGIDAVKTENDTRQQITWSQMPATPLAILIACDPLCCRAVRFTTHELLLRLVVDLVAREAVREALLSCYGYLNRLYALGVGLAEDTIFAISVQVFTTPSLVRGSLDSLPHCILQSLHETFSLARIQADRQRRRRSGEEARDLYTWLDSDIIRNRRYCHALRDLEYILHTEDVSAAFLAPEGTALGGVIAPSPKALDLWLEILVLLESMDPQLRRGENLPHVEFESRRWLFTFNLSLNIASASEIVVRRCLDPPDVETKRAAIKTHGLPAVCAALLKFHTSRLHMRVRATENDPTEICSQHWCLRKDGLGLDYDVTTLPVSVHLPLTRFLVQLALRISDSGEDSILPSAKTWSCHASSLIESARTLLSVGEHCDDSDEQLVWRSLGLALMESSLRALAYCAHVNAGLWRRNGQVAMSSYISYSSPPICHSLRDVDLAAVQVAATVLPPDSVVESILRAFRVSLDNDDEQSRFDADVRGSLLAAAIECICVLVTDMPVQQTGSEANVRRELVHAMAAEPRRHSELSTIVASLSNSRCPRSPIDTILEVVAVRQNELWEIRPEVAMDEYDPCFPRLLRPAHEKAIERIFNWRKDQVLPLVRPPPHVRPTFKTVRSRILQCASTQGLILTGLTTTSTVLQVRARAVHLATLLVHDTNGQCSDSLVDALRTAKKYDLGPLYAQGLDWLLTKLGNDQALSSSSISTESVDVENGKSKGDAARRRAMALMAARQATFAAVLETEDEDEETPIGSSASSVNASNSPKNEEKVSCIVCRGSSAHSGETPCFIGLAQRSVQLYRATERGMRRARRRARLCRTNVTSNGMTRLYSSARAASKEKKFDECTGIVHEGETVVVRSLLAGGARLESGWLPSRCLGDRLIEDDFRAWGTTRINVSSCGHAVHPSCFDSYVGALLNKAVSGEPFEGQRVADIGREQFLCPLCRGLSNCLIPGTSKVAYSVENQALLDKPWTGIETFASHEIDEDVKMAGVDDLAWSSEEMEAWCKYTDNEALLRTDEPNWDVQNYWGRRFSSSLCDVGDGPSDTGPSKIAELRITWDVAAYGATCIGLRSQADQDAGTQQLYPGAATSLKQNEHGARLVCQALRYFPRVLLNTDDSKSMSEVRARLSALLAGRIFSNEPSSAVEERGVVSSYNSDARTWRRAGEQRALLALSTPLLDWDLSVFLCAIVSIWPKELLARTLALVAVAKLAQLLEGEDVSWLDSERKDALEMEYSRFLRFSAFVLEAHVPNLELPSLQAALEAVTELSIAWNRHRYLSKCAVPLAYRPLQDTEITEKLPVLVIPGVSPPSDDDINLTSLDKVPCELSRFARLPSNLNVRFVRLPKSFTELYTNLVTKYHDKDEEGPAICMLCGTVLASSRRTRFQHQGPCTRHAMMHTDSIGVFFLVLKCASLITFESKAAYGRSLYLDNFGEEDHNLRRGAPLQLNEGRVRALEDLYNSHGIAQEVARRRNSSTHVISDDYY